MAITSSLSKLFENAGTTKAPTGTGYTNLNRLFSANQNNQLGAKVAGNIQNQIGGVQTQLGQQQTQFQTEAEKNRLDSEANKSARDSIIGRFADPSTSGGELAEEDVNKFTQFRGGQYAGPKGLQDTSSLSTQAQQIAGQTNNLTPSGTQELLRRNVGTGRYTQGQQRLDSLLLDRSGLRQVGREAQGLGTEINRANLAAQGQAQALTGQAQQFAADTNKQLTGALSGLDTQAQNQLASAQAVEKDRLARIQAVQDFAAGKVAQKDASGNVVKDQYGNTVYDTSAANPRGGSTDPYTQIDSLRSLLLEKGANQNEVDQLLGGGDQTKQKAAYDAAQESARVLYLNDVLGRQESGWTNPLVESGRLSAKDAFAINFRGSSEAARKAGVTGEAKQRALAARDRALQDLKNGLGTSTFANVKYGTSWASNETGGRTTNQDYRNMMKQAETLYSPKGTAGIALNKGTLENFYQNLAGSLANSQAAQGLTAQGVASAPLRANYGALAQLLGTPDVNPYSGDPTYSQGQFLLNPDAIARTV